MLRLLLASDPTRVFLSVSPLGFANTKTSNTLLAASRFLRATRVPVIL